MNVAFFPESLRSNPYLDLLEAALGRQGAVVVPVGSDYLSGRWLWMHRRDVHVLHFHWLQHHYKQAADRGSWGALTKFVLQLCLARLLGYRLVWTMHNVLPHERIGRTDVAARWAMAWLAHSVIVLCEEGRRLLKKHYRRTHSVIVAAHGNMLGIYPDDLSDIEARERLGLGRDDRVFLFFGGIRAHKNVEGLIGAFRQLKGDSLRLLIVGAPFSTDLAERVRALATADERVNCVLAFVADADVQRYMRAADFVVLPFADVLGSSSVVLALSFERPVIAPRTGCVPEIVTASAGILYDSDDPQGLLEALRAACTADICAMKAGAVGAARTLSWVTAAVATKAAYGLPTSGADILSGHER